MAKFVLAIFARPLRSRGYKEGSKRFCWATACKDPSLIQINLVECQGSRCKVLDTEMWQHKDFQVFTKTLFFLDMIIETLLHLYL